MKYRVVKEQGVYKPQVRVFFFWWCSIESEALFHTTLEGALAAIEEHKRTFKRRKTEVVWRW